MTARPEHEQLKRKTKGRKELDESRAEIKRHQARRREGEGSEKHRDRRAKGKKKTADHWSRRIFQHESGSLMGGGCARDSTWVSAKTASQVTSAARGLHLFREGRRPRTSRGKGRLPLRLA